MTDGKNSARYYKQFEKLLTRFRRKLAGYIKDPCVENIHGIRTCFRRLEACYSIFPSSIRTKSSDDYLALGKQFFRLNSAVRDSDVLAEKLFDTLARNAALKKHLHQIRAQNLQQAMKLAEQLDRLPEPHLVTPDEGSKLRLDRQLRYKVEYRINTIRHFIPIVMDSEDNTEELHSMRKQARDASKAMKQLKKLQTQAGNIRDCDLTLALLGEHENQVRNASMLIASESDTRHRCYKKLRSLLSKDLWKPLRKLA
jgi:CHAD domain-containing protein